jgi:hypothetical protein
VDRTLTGPLLSLFCHPFETLILRWNWKSALFSSLCRGAIFFVVNLGAGFHAATGAMTAEFVYRAITAGFYGAITQAFRAAQAGRAALRVTLGVLAFSHTIEFAVHSLRHTPNLRASILVSVLFTILSTLFNLYAMRQGVLIVGHEGRSLAEDLRALPGIILSFVRSPIGLLFSKSDR